MDIPVGGDMAVPEGGAPVEAVPQPSSVMRASRAEYWGRTGELYGLWIKKIIFSYLTLGIYSFWGKTNIRRYMTAATELDGDRFEYLGTGKELFIGFLKIIPFYILFVLTLAVFHIFAGEDVASFVSLAVVWLLVPVARYAALRYRFNRLSWRGIRTSMAGSAFHYGGYFFIGTLKSIFTLGWLNPVVDLGRIEYKATYMWFGRGGFSFGGADPSALAKVNIVTLLLAIPTLGFSRLWYSAAVYREAARALSLGPLRFKSKITGGGLFKLVIVNILILLCTLGLGIPVIMQRNTRFMVDNLVVGGDISSVRAAQGARRKAGAAEGMEDAFGISDDSLGGFIG